MRFPQTRPSPLVLSCGADWSSEFQCSPQDEMGVPQELSTKEDDICFALLQVVVCLFAVEDEADSANVEFWNGLSDTICEMDL